MAASRRERIVLVGPTHPHAGGIAQHTTRLALELESRGLSVTVESWKAQYPKRLYPGPMRVPKDEPEVGIPTTVVERLTWYNPLSWIAAARRFRDARTVGFSIPTPFHAIPYLVMLSQLSTRTFSLGIVHNVLPHEPKPLDQRLMSLLLRRLDRIIVHGNRERDNAESLGVVAQRITSVPLPSPWHAIRDGGEKPRNPVSRALQLLFFGTVRHYKGLDILLEALALTTNTELTIAGQFWETENDYRALVEKLGLQNRVRIRSGYLAQSEFLEVFGSADVLVMPYRSGTGSIVRDLGFAHGLPVIASDTGAISEGIEDGVTGRVVAPDDVSSLARAIQEVQAPDTLSQWTNAVWKRSSRQAEDWENYTQAIVQHQSVSDPGGKT